jgi:hypothetical protein
MQSWLISQDVITVRGPSGGDVDVTDRHTATDHPFGETVRHRMSPRPRGKPLAPPWVMPNQTKWPVAAPSRADVGPRTHTLLSECGGHR